MKCEASWFSSRMSVDTERMKRSFHSVACLHVNFSLSSGSPPMPSTSSSSLTNEVPKPPTREPPATRPPYTPTSGGQAPHSHQFPRTRKMFDKGPEQVEDRPNFVQISFKQRFLVIWKWTWCCFWLSVALWTTKVCSCVQAAEDGDEPGGHRNYICAALQTGLCDWSAKYFAQPVMKVMSSLFHHSWLYTLFAFTYQSAPPVLSFRYVCVCFIRRPPRSCRPILFSWPWYLEGPQRPDLRSISLSWLGFLRNAMREFSSN